MKRPPDQPIAYSAWDPHLFLLGGIGAAILGLIGGFLLTVLIPRGSLGASEYHVWRWEAENVIPSLFRHVGIGQDLNSESTERALQEYFRLTTSIRNAESEPDPDFALIASAKAERSIYENDVERIVESRIDEAIRAAGVQRNLPVFRGISITWPPVDFELTTPPQLLVRSPRSEIRRAGDTLLRDDISLAKIEEIEASTESDETTSIVVPIGGIAVYPAIVRDDRSYDSLLNTASHEWVHHYLAFFPLGRQWGSGGDAEPLNETVADLAGTEIANRVREQHPTEFEPGTDGRRAASPPSDLDFNTEMRALRLSVDELLEAGDVAGAEQLMEDTRLRLEEHGIFIRRLNQAYFAFYGTYAESAASSNPIGPLVRRVWDATGDVGVFLTLMRDVTTRSDLEQLVEVLEAGSPAD